MVHVLPIAGRRDEGEVGRSRPDQQRTNLNQYRWTDQNAWASQAAFNKAIGRVEKWPGLEADETPRPLTPENARELAENSVRRVEEARAKHGLPPMKVYPGDFGRPGR